MKNYLKNKQSKNVLKTCNILNENILESPELENKIENSNNKEDNIENL